MYKKITAILWSIYLFALAIYWFRLGGENTIILGSTSYLFIAFFAVLGGIFSLKLYGFKGSRAKTLLFLTLGVSCLFVGEILFYWYEFFLNTDPFPSIADIFYLVSYPLILVALYNEIQQTNLSWKKIHASIIFLFGITASLFALIVFYFGVYVAYDAQADFLSNSIAISYGVGDMFLIIADLFVVVLAWEFRGGKYSRSWILLFLSFFAMLIADILFAIYYDQYKGEEWFYRSLLDTLWMLSYILFAQGLFSFGSAILAAKSQLRSIKLIKEKTKHT